MKWQDTIASDARYGDVAERIFGEAEIIWECSEADYQGSCNVLAKMLDGSFVHYEWSYGSCSGCDEWEDRDLTDDEVEAEMRGAMAVLPDADVALRYFGLEGEYAEAAVQSANVATNGSIPGMVRQLAGGVGREFLAAGSALRQYLAETQTSTESEQVSVLGVSLVAEVGPNN